MFAVALAVGQLGTPTTISSAKAQVAAIANATAPPNVFPIFFIVLPPC